MSQVVDDYRLSVICEKVNELCKLAHRKPAASIVMAARKYLSPHWIRLRASSILEDDVRFYVTLLPSGEQGVHILLPSKIDSLATYRLCCTELMRVIGMVALILNHDEPERVQHNGSAAQKAFLGGLEEGFVRRRGFLASRAHHNRYALEFICTSIFGERSYFLKDKIEPLLGKYLKP